MDFLKGITDPGWLAFALFFLGIIFFMAYNRQRESRRILNKFDEKDIVITSGLEQYIPRGLIIGCVTEINRESSELWQTARLTPFSDFNKLTVISILLPSDG